MHETLLSLMDSFGVPENTRMPVCVYVPAIKGVNMNCIFRGDERNAAKIIENRVYNCPRLFEIAWGIELCAYVVSYKKGRLMSSVNGEINRE